MKRLASTGKTTDSSFAARPGCIPRRAQGARFAIRPLILALAAVHPLIAYANPQGPNVITGTATFQNLGKTLTVTNSNGAVINWQAFSVATGEAVRFVQPSSTSQVLNRITGGSPSEILGTLWSNGRVFIVNPNGVVFGANAQVDVAGLVATSLGISNADFAAGRMNFAGSSSAGAVQNDGTVHAGAGDVILIAPQVENSGLIQAPGGSILLAAGHSVTIADARHPEVGVVVSAPGDSALNLGNLVAQNVSVFSSIVTSSGTIDAQGATVGAGGHVHLYGEDSVTLSGTIAAGGSASGGSVVIDGAAVSLTSTARIDASGASQGGTVLLGGGLHGADASVVNAATTTIASGAEVDANAGSGGRAGTIVAWSNDSTLVEGSLSAASAGGAGSQGGYIETSSHGTLNVPGASISAAAPGGTAGTWLLDPSNLTVVHGAGSAGSGTINPPTSSSVTDGQINATLAGGTDVSLLTSAGTGGSGNITVYGSGDAGGAVSIQNVGGGARTLTLSGQGTIAIDSQASIAGSAGNPLSVVISTPGAVNDNGTIDNQAGTTTVTAGTFTLQSYGILRNGTLLTSALNASSGTLDNETIGSNLAVSGGAVIVTNNLTLGNNVTLTNGSQIYFEGSNVQQVGSLGSSAIVLNNGTMHNYYAGATDQVVFGPGLTISGTGGIGTYNGGVTNAGTIDAGPNFSLNGSGTFTNSGTFSAVNGNVTLDPGIFNNTGTVNVTAGTLYIDPQAAALGFTNSGVINLSAGILQVGGNYTAAQWAAGHLVRSSGTSLELEPGIIDLAGGTLDIGSTGNFGTGGLTSANSTTFHNGTLTSASGTPLSGSSATFDGITLGDNFSLASNTTVYVPNTLTLASGTTLTLQGSLDFSGTTATPQHLATTGSATVALSGGSFNNYYANAAATLTIDPGITMTGNGNLYSYNAGVTNAGTITLSSGYSTLGGNTSWTNSGTLNVNGSATVSINPTVFNNTGTLTEAGTATLTMAPNAAEPAFLNSGTFNLNAGTFNLEGNNTTAALSGGHFVRTGGSFDLVSGTFDLQGSTLDIGSGGLFQTGGLTGATGGTIENGTIVSADGTKFTTSGVSLSGITIGSNLTFNSGGYVYVPTNLTLVGGVTLDLAGGGLDFSGSNLTQHLTTSTAATVNLSSGSLNNYYAGGSTLVIDPGITVTGPGTIYGYNAGIDNKGTINLPSGYSTLGGSVTFQNDGTINVSGGTTTVDPVVFANSATGVVNETGGTITLETSSSGLGFTNVGLFDLAGGTLQLDSNLDFSAFNKPYFTRAASGTSVTFAGGSLNLNGGTLDIGSNGLFQNGGLGQSSAVTFSNGTIISSDGTPFDPSGATLAGITFGSSITFSPSASAYITGNLTLTGGTTLNLGNGGLNFSGSGTQHLAATGPTAVQISGGYIQNYYGQTGETLTLDAPITITGTGSLNAYNGGIINNAAINFATGAYSSLGGSGTFTNQATITINSGTYQASLSPTTLINAGTITTTGTTAIEPSTFQNNGTLTSTGGTLTIAPQGAAYPNFTNPGQLNLEGGTLVLGGHFTVNQLAAADYTRSAGTTVNTTTGYFDLLGTTLDIGSGGLFQQGGLGQANYTTFHNGTIVSNDGTVFYPTGATLDGITFGSNMTFASGSSAYVLQDLVLAGGTTLSLGNGQLNFDGTGSAQHLRSTGSAQVTIAQGEIDNYYAGASTPLILDPSVTYSGYGTFGSYGAGITNNTTISFNGAGTAEIYGSGTFTNAGVLNVNATGETAYIQPTVFANTGQLNVEAGLADVNPGTFNNSGTTTVAGGRLTISASGSGFPNFLNSGTLLLENGTLILGGNLNATPLTAPHFVRSAGTQVELNNATYDLAGGTLDIGSGGLFQTGGLTSTTSTVFENGTLVSGDGTLLTASGITFDNVALGGSSFVLAPSSLVYIEGNLSLASGMTFNSASGTLEFESSSAQHITSPGTATIVSAGTQFSNYYQPSGATLTIDPSITITGYGTLASYGGGIVNNGTIVFTGAGGSYVEGSSGFTNAGKMSIGAAGITNYVEPNGALVNTGTLDLTGGSVYVFSNGAAGTTNWTNDGTLEVAANTVMYLNNRNLTNSATGTLRGDGTIDLGSIATYVNGGYVYSGYTLANAGTIDPGFGANGTGTLTLYGSLTNSAGSTLHVDLGGTGAGQYDQLAVVGSIPQSSYTIPVTATLPSNLVIAEVGKSVPGGYFANLGDAFPDIVTVNGGATGLSGSFTNTTIPADVAFSFTQAPFGISNTTTSITRWTGASDTSPALWSDYGNWSRGTPGALKDVVVTGGPTITLDTAGAEHSLALSGTLDVTTGGSMTVTGTFNGTGGTLDVSGGTLAYNPTNVVDPAAITVSAGTFTAAPTGPMSVASFDQSGGTSTLSVPLTAQAFTETGGVFNGQAVTVPGSFTLTAGTFNNAGLLTLSGTSPLTGGTLAGAGGVLIPASGSVVVANGGTVNINEQVDNAGLIDVTSGAQLVLNSPSAQDVNTGTITLAGGTMTVHQSGTSPTFSMNGGAINVTTPTDFTVDGGAFDWGGGSLTGLNLINGATLAFTGTGTRVLNGANLTLNNLTLTGGLDIASGTVTLNGQTTLSPDSSLQLSGGTLNMTAGGTLDSGSTLTLSGGNALVGGPLNILAGATFNDQNPRVLGFGSAFNDGGTVNITAGGVTLNGGGTDSGAFNVGSGTSLTFAGGTTTLTDGASISGPGSINYTGGNLINNASAELPLTVAAGTTLTLNNQTLGGSGTVTVNGTLSATNSTVTNNIVTSDTGVVHTFGTDTFSGSTTNAGTFQIMTGTTTVSGGFTANAGLVELGQSDTQPANLTVGGSGLTVNGGMLRGSGTIGGNLTVNGGMLAPGYSPGAITVNGNLVLGEGAVTQIQIGGTTPGTLFDTITVNGTATLGGTLDVIPYNGYAPVNGQQFNFMTFNSSSGAFESTSITSSATMTIAANPTGLFAAMPGAVIPNSGPPPVVTPPATTPGTPSTSTPVTVDSSVLADLQATDVVCAIDETGNGSGNGSSGQSSGGGSGSGGSGSAGGGSNDVTQPDANYDWSARSCRAN